MLERGLRNGFTQAREDKQGRERDDHGSGAAVGSGSSRRRALSRNTFVDIPTWRL